MACNCIDTVEQNTLNHLKESNPKNDYSETELGWGNDGLQNIAFSLGENGGRKPYFIFKTKHTFTKVNGEQSKVVNSSVNIYTTFCPFCGLRYHEEKEEG